MRISAALIISDSVVNLPSPILTELAICSEGKPKAVKTWEGVSTPEEQAAPVEMAI